MVRRLLACIALVAVLLAAGPVYAVGYWNLPGNVCQCWGYGWGAGHHACFVLGPISHDSALAHNEVRLPCAPHPPYAYYNSGSYNYDFRQPAQLAPVEYLPSPQVAAPTTEALPAEASTRETPVPTLTPDPLPMQEEPAPPRALFEPPVE